MNKTIELEYLVHSTKPDVIIRTETWLNSNITSQEFLGPNWTTEYSARTDPISHMVGP